MALLKNGLALMGGGARAAYQVGVLRAISEIIKSKESPFRIITGISAGAINGAWIASHAQSFEHGTHTLSEMWQTLEMEKIFRTDAASLLNISAHWLKDLSMGQWLGKSKMTYILDTTPLRELLEKNLPYGNVHKNIESGLLYGFGVTATNYETGLAVTFYEGDKSIQPWSRGSRLGVREKVDLDHVLASAAIPMFFKPILLKNGYYGDGGIRGNSPLSSAIHLGAERILAIGVEHKRTALPNQDKPQLTNISIGDIIGVLLNAMFFGSLEDDVERLQRINRTISIITPEKMASEPDRLRPVRLLVIRPSRDLGTLASDEFSSFPATLRHLLKGLGVTDEKGWDLLSYLAFRSSYTTQLFDLGYKDAFLQEKEILEFFEEE